MITKTGQIFGIVEGTILVRILLSTMYHPQVHSYACLNQETAKVVFISNGTNQLFLGTNQVNFHDVSSDFLPMTILLYHELQYPPPKSS